MALPWASGPDLGRAEQLESTLREKHHVGAEQAAAAAQLFDSEEMALKFIGKASEGGNAFRSPWKEYYSRKYKRYYYVSSNDNTWHIPPEVQFKEWLLDTQLYGVDVVVACAVFRAIHLLLDQHWHLPTELWECMKLLSKLVGNITQCGNSNPKYRQIKTDNPKIQDKVLALSGAEGVLRAAGFQRQGNILVFPDQASPVTMKVATLVAAKLQQLIDTKGWTGTAVQVDDDASSSGVSAKMSKWHGQPGFRYQQEIYCCSVCDHPINDGSERLFTRSHEAPKGEFRYECQQCIDEGGFNLCEKCYDKVCEGEALHIPGHTFRTHHPRESRHWMYGQESANNPWGVALGRGGSAARARERLKDRTGM